MRRWSVVLLIVWAIGMAGGVRAEESDRTARLATFLDQVCGAEGEGVTTEFCDMAVGEILFRGPGGAEITLPVLVADDSSERAAGYQNIAPSAMDQTAIFFVFPSPLAGAFHMCNVARPLDILWIRKDGGVLDGRTMMPGDVRPAWSCSQLYEPARFGAYQYALETPPGMLASLGLSPDDPSGWKLQVEGWMQR